MGPTVSRAHEAMVPIHRDFEAAGGDSGECDVCIIIVM